MIKSVKAYAATSATAPLALHPITRRPLRPDDVEIDILYCGVCHSDLHTARNDWGWTSYPIVPGHEIIGRVMAVGSQVSKFKVGDRVGVGCMVDSCGHCDACSEGHEQHCGGGATYTYGAPDRIDGTLTQGGYSEKVVVKESFVVRIPDNLALQAAAPLLCAGITTWSPLKNAEIGPGSRVAVVGLGGLGHMAIKLAKALGAEVTLFTRSPGKEEDAYWCRRMRYASLSAALRLSFLSVQALTHPALMRLRQGATATSVWRGRFAAGAICWAAR